MNHQYQLTKLAVKGGCAAKQGPKVLQEILQQLPDMPHDHLLVGYQSSDDAAVYQLNEEQAVIQTVDFFPPPVDDPYLFGQIAATNALSDVYAMGGTPILALNLLAFPCSLPAEPEQRCVRWFPAKAPHASTDCWIPMASQKRFSTDSMRVTVRWHCRTSSRLRSADVQITA